MKIEADTPDEYAANVPSERQPYFDQLRSTINQSIPKGFEECLSYGMIGWVVPHSIYPSGYHCNPKLPLPFTSIASQKHFVAFYHSGIYADASIHDWFVKEYPKHCKLKLDMGKSCVRFKKPEQIPFELIGELMQKMTVDQWIDLYEVRNKR